MRPTRLLPLVCATLLAVPSSAQCPDELLVPLDNEPGDRFGLNVALSGSLALIGAPFDDDDGERSGAAYVWERQSTGWVEVAKLTASDAAMGDRFGFAVALDGERAVVGARYDQDVGYGTGAIYVFERQGGAWVETAKLQPDNAQAGDLFGNDIDLEGDTIVVGSSAHGTGALAQSGAAFVFRQVGGTWQQTGKLTPIELQSGDTFGEAVAISDGRIAVSAARQDVQGTNSGSVYIYSQFGGFWSQEAKIVPPGGSEFDLFGASLSLDGTRLIVGSVLDDDFGTDAGSCYIYQRQFGVWQLVEEIGPSDPTLFAQFGVSVAIEGQRALVGADRDTAAGPASGSIYVFEQSASGWEQVAKLRVAEVAPSDTFGHAVALDGGRLLVGAPFHDAAHADGGAAWIYESFQPALQADLSALSLAAGGTQQFNLRTCASLAGRPYLLLSTASGNSPGQLLDGQLLPLQVDPLLEASAALANQAPWTDSVGFLDANGFASARFSVPPGPWPGLAGTTLHHAFLVFDLAGPKVVLGSNAVALDLLP